jgi:hypothetical protein
VYQLAGGGGSYTFSCVMGMEVCDPLCRLWCTPAAAAVPAGLPMLIVRHTPPCAAVC